MIKVNWKLCLCLLVIKKSVLFFTENECKAKPAAPEGHSVLLLLHRVARLESFLLHYKLNAYSCKSRLLVQRKFFIVNPPNLATTPLYSTYTIKLEYSNSNNIEFAVGAELANITIVTDAYNYISNRPFRLLASITLTSNTSL